MEGESIYKELSRKLFMENSMILPKIWKLLCGEDEARLLDAMPATAEELAGRFNMSDEQVASVLDALFNRGVVFEQMKDGVLYYRMPRHVVQFHDATLLWKEAPDEMVALWVEFMETEYPSLLELITTAKMPAFMRVIPVNYTLQSKDQVLAYEDAARLVTDANSIAVVDCVCRKSQKKCNAPVNVCMQLNRGADYAIKRGTGRKIDAAEAMEILRKAEKAGLVHLTENRAGQSNVICNCCTCCCEMLRFATSVKTGGVLSPSRFMALVDDALCTSCGTCTEICPVGAIRLDEEGGAGVWDTCIGCGLCATVCPAGAISMDPVRDRDFIPK